MIAEHPWRRYTGLRAEDRVLIGLSALGLSEAEMGQYVGSVKAKVVSQLRRIRKHLGANCKSHMVALAIDAYEVNPLPMDNPMVLQSRDAEILGMLREGNTTEQIARKTGLTYCSIKIRIERMLDRNNALNSAHLVALYCSQEFYGDAYFQD